MVVGDDSMSNLTSNEASMSSNSNIINEMGSSTLYSYHHHLPITSFASPNKNNQKQQQQQEQQPPAKKKRNLPGNPDPEAEVVALSPRSLMATNRFVCEICNKGFQRDQNLQLHRRGHNLPWKLKQRSNKDVVKKKVYICPEPSCVHHDPSRALGDLTGIKKHFFRKHGEKKWKCDKCSKRYAVHSDWKAHSKICGTREYRCDCGTLFSRRDSFITHRAFCDALSQESSRSLVAGVSPQIGSTQTAPNQIHGSFNHLYLPLKQESPAFGGGGLPPWLSSADQPGAGGPSPINSLLTRLDQGIQQNPNPNFLPTLISSSSSSSAATASHSLMSATALLQKAAQMGVTMSSKMPGQQTSLSSEQSILIRPHQDHVAAAVVLPTRDEMATGFLQYDHLAASSFGTNNNKLPGLPSPCNIMELQDHISAAMAASLPSTGGGFDGSTLSFEGGFQAMMNSKLSESAHLMSTARKGSSGRGDDLTRDFLGLRAFPHRNNDFADMAGLDHMGGGGPSSYDQQDNQNQGTWQD